MREQKDILMEYLDKGKILPFFCYKICFYCKTIDKEGYKAMIKNKKIALILIGVLLIVQVGCRANKNEDPLEGRDINDSTVEVGAPDKAIIDRSESVSDLVVELFGVDNATCIIFNDIAVVGIKMAYDAELTDAMKETIINLVVENDSMIRQVVITENEKIFEQVENIIGGLMKGKPYDGYVTEITRIIEKIKKDN
jgi:YhcN/YlaJ family sporulation lipoprotein